jgi:hypothetical protein
MATNPTRSISEQLNAAQVTISNTLADAELQARVAGFGYTVEKLAAGRQLYDRALAAVSAQAAAAGAQQQATAHLRAADAIARDAYQALAQVARAAFAKDKAQLAGLGLTGRMPRTTAAFLAAAYTLFDNARGVADLQAALAAYGYDPARLTGERAKIAAFDTANQAQEAAKGAAQQATHDQKAALAALTDWLVEYRKIARVALRDQPQLLEKLGVTVRARQAPGSARE